MKELKNRPIKTDGYSSHTLHARRHQRRIDAEIRACHPKKSISARRFRIACAGSETEVSALLRDGLNNFLHASEKTRRAWQSTARKRLAYLQSRNPVRK